MKLSVGKMIDYYGPQRIKHVLVLSDLRVVYVAIPKAACSSMKLYFERIHRGTPDEDISSIHKNLTVPSLDTFKQKTIRALEDEEPFFGFSVVRDPMRRIVSAYRDKMRDPHFRSQINKTLDRADLTQKVSFNQFLAAIQMQTSRQMNPHWRPQVDLLMSDALDYDHLCRLEHLEDDMNYLFEATQMPRQPVPHSNKVRDVEDFTPSAAQRTKIYDIYNQEFEALGY